MEDWNKKLLTAARGGDVKTFKLCLQNDADIDYQDVDGETALMFAAQRGRLEICRLLIDRGCKIDTTTRYGQTALMRAAEEGHLEICRLLIDRGCKINITQEYGETALMFAAQRGRLEICRLLIDRGCKIDITDRDGETALHLAARGGYLQITRCLVEQGGASPLVTTHEGQTPYDVAAASQQGQYKKVMEYLQTVMSEKWIEDDLVPTEIKLMADKRSIDLYLKLLESGSEKKRDIRLVVVGKQGAGKTSLIRRLFGEDITDVTSTNGIEIHKIKCKAMSDDGIWNKLDGTNEETEIHARLLKRFKGTIEASVEEGVHHIVKENTPSTSFDESETVTQPKKRKIQVTTESKVEPLATSKQPNLSLEQAKMDIETMLKSYVDLHDKEEYATLFLWDFAGDEEFYHTHQTFLSQDAIYLVVTKLNEADDKNAQEMFQLWMNSIHCYCRLDDQKNKAESNTGEMHERMIAKDDWLDPPVVVVGSHRDKVEPSYGQTIEDACRDCLDKYVEDVSADARRHISDKYEYFISNTEDNPSVFQLIRQNLLNLATTMKTWNQDYPIKFIQLEKCLQEKKKELPIISLNEIKQISTETFYPLNLEELMLYLKFHHELRALVYFEDLPDYIILDTQWLSDAFKCIITAEKFQSPACRHVLKDEWHDLKNRGILHSVVLDQILETNKKIFKFVEKQNLFQHIDHILKVMEKFDIIIRPSVSDRDAADTKPYYYIPCMVKDVPDCPIHEQFNVTEKNCTKSTWLCFKFKFLPGHLINHLIASLSRKYDIAEVPVRGLTKRPIALFRGTVVFKLQKTSKLLVMTYPNVIQIQVWDFGKHCNIERCLFKDIDDFVTREINTIICKRFKMTTVKFDKMLGCSLAEPDRVTGFYEQDADYFCEMCTETHINEWSDHAPIQPTKIFEKTQHVPGSYSCIENTSQIQSTSTKSIMSTDAQDVSLKTVGKIQKTFISEEFDRLFKISFSFGLELVIDKRLEDEYSKLMQTNKLSKNKDVEGKNSNMKEFVHICELRKTYMHTEQPKNDLIDAIRKGKNLRARWLLSNFEFDLFMLDIYRNTLEVSNIEMSKALAWIITNKLFIKYKNMFNLERFRIWPGFRCVCNKKDILRICSDQMEIIIELEETIIEISDEFFGFKVRQLSYEKESKEARTVTSCLSEHWKSDVCCDNIVIPGTEAASLFDNHSNCSLICSSIVRSTGILTNHRIEPVRCIQLYCTVKGVIPVGEKHFPSSVCHYPTDVLEGYPLLATGIKIGEKVGTLDSTGNFKSQGTLGGFIYHLGFKCFLTCAHVVFDLETLLGQIPNEIDKTGIEVFKPSLTTNTPDNCGSVIRRIFEHSDKDKTSIDAALVNIESTVTLDPQNIIFDQFGFSRSMTHLGLSSMDLNEICLDITDIRHSKAELLCSGGFLKIKDKVTIKAPEDFVEVQFPPVGGQPQQGHAQPLMIGTTAHMQLNTTNLAGQRVFRMYNQLLLKIPLNLGDSGTCIYVIGNNEQKGCLGMAIAFLSFGQCIVTPLKEILKKLKH